MNSKKILTLSATLLMALTVASCGNKKPDKPSSSTSAPTSETSSSAAQGSSETSEASSSATTTVPGRNEEKSAWQLPDAGFDTEAPVTIKFYSTMGKNLLEKFDAYLEDFNAIYPNIEVVHSQPGSYDDVLDQIKTELSVSTPENPSGPDLAYCYSDHVALYNKTKAVVKLDNLLYDPELGLTGDQYRDYIKGYLEEGRSFGDGLYYTMPWSKSTEILYYNKDVFTKEGLNVPTTWFGENDPNSMEYVCKKLKEKYPDSTPLGYDSESNWFITMTEQLQTPYTSATGNHFLFNDPKNHDFLNKFKEWFEKGYVTTQQIYGSYTSGLFVSTDKANSFMSIGSSAGATHQIPTMVEGKYPFEVGMAEIPQANENNKKVISQGPSVCVFNQGDPQKIMASWLLIKYFTTNVEFQAEFSIASGYVPVIKSVSENEIYKTHIANASKPLTEVDQKNRASAMAANICIQQEENYFTSPAFVGSSTARIQVGNALAQILQGKATIEKALADAVDACEASL